MKLVLTLLARNEADIVDAHVAFHLHAGVDFVIATDNRSDDGTTDILERYEREGVLRLIREPSTRMRQGDWVTRMARLAASEHGADWVINSDADEFWWPRAGSLKDVLATIPSRYGVVRGCWRHFLPRAVPAPAPAKPAPALSSGSVEPTPVPAPAPAKPAPALSSGSVEPTPVDGSFFAERMIVRLTAPAHPGDKRTIYHAHQKVAHRGDASVEVEPGNHDASGAGLEPLRGWHPLEVLHFSFRTSEQLERKAHEGWANMTADEAGLHKVLLLEASRDGLVSEHFESFLVDDAALERGLAAGTLAIDTRLRDALRAIRAPEGERFLLPSEIAEPQLSFVRPDVREDATYAGEASVLEDVDGIVRAERRVEALEERVASLEGGRLARLLVRRS